MRVLVTIAIAAIALVGLFGCERIALDRQMEELCKKDGGVRVYETVTLPSSEFSNVGQPLAQYWKAQIPEAERLGPQYRYVQRREILVGQGARPEKGEGQLVKWYYAVYRRSDDRLLGESVSYERGGGDGIAFGLQPSGNACPLPRKDLAQSIFIKGK